MLDLKSQYTALGAGHFLSQPTFGYYDSLFRCHASDIFRYRTGHFAEAIKLKHTHGQDQNAATAVLQAPNGKTCTNSVVQFILPKPTGFYHAGCFETKNAWSSAEIVHVDNLKELAKRFRLHKSIPNFFRDYTTEDSLVNVLKRYVRNNAAFLSETPSVARGRRVDNSQTDLDGATTVSGGDVSNVVTYTVSSMDGAFSSTERRVATNSSDTRVRARDDASAGALVPEITCATVGDSRYSQRACGVSVGRYGGVLSSDIIQPGGTGSSSAAQALKGATFAPLGTMSSSPSGRYSRGISGVPRRPMQPKRSAKVREILLDTTDMMVEDSTLV